MSQLFADSDLDQAIEELKLTLPIEALRSIIKDREKHHKPRSELRRRLELLRALQMAREAA